MSDISKFKAQRNKVNNLKKVSKQLFYENINGMIDLLTTTDSKSYWKLMRRLINKSGTVTSIPCLRNPYNGEVINI